ncbi:MAG: hypothetical protein ACKVP7_13995 [Hyphomicrobiaceae bacterium]
MRSGIDDVEEFRVGYRYRLGRKRETGDAMSQALPHSEGAHPPDAMEVRSLNWRQRGAAWVLWCAFSACALAVACGSLPVAYRYGVGTASGAHLDPTWQGAAFVALDVFKMVVILAAPALVARGSKALAAGCLVVWLALSTLSVWAITASELIERRALGSTHQNQELAALDFRRDVARLESELAVIANARPAKSVFAEIEALKRDRLWTSSRGCTEATIAASRDFCAAYDRLFGELAAAERAAGLRSEISSKVAARPTPPKHGAEASPELTMIAEVAGMSPATVGFWRALALAIIWEVSAAVGLAAVGRLCPRAAAKDADSGQVRRTDPPPPVRSVPVQQECSPVHDAGPPVQVPHSPGLLICPADLSAISIQPTRSPVQHEAMASMPPLPRTGVGQEAEQAVHAFVQMLDRDPQGTVAGAALFRAYRAQRSQHGWPDLSARKFGENARVAVEALGGTKRRSNGSVYTGVCIPGSWSIRLATQASTGNGAAGEKSSTPEMISSRATQCMPVPLVQAQS